MLLRGFAGLAMPAGTGVHNLRRSVLPCGEGVEHELFRGLACALFNETQDLNADASGVGPLDAKNAKLECPLFSRPR